MRSEQLAFFAGGCLGIVVFMFLSMNSDPVSSERTQCAIWCQSTERAGALTSDGSCVCGEVVDVPEVTP